MLTMKKLPFLLCVTTLLLAAFPVSATDIRSVHTDLYLHWNGNAVVYQRWDVVISSGTEWYIPIQNMGQRSIRDFRVFENDEEYENEGRGWNSKRTLQQKKFRCGIAETGPDSVELCWGQGEYGAHVYHIMYIVDNLIQASADGENDMFNWQFLNDEWSAPPQEVSMTVYNYADSAYVWQAGEGGNLGVWVFGCEADVEAADHEVHVTSTEPFTYDSHLTLMMRFDKGLFHPKTTDPRSFETLRDEAFLDSDYGFSEEDYDWQQEEKGFLYYLKKVLKTLFEIAVGVAIPVFFLLILPALLIMAWRKVTGRRYKKSVFGKKRITDFSHELPLDGKLYAAYSLLSEGDHLNGGDKLFSRLIGAYFLRWVHRGLVVCEKDPAKEGRVNLRFTEATPDGLLTMDPLEQKYYKSARLAAGSNLILEADEFSRWSKANYLTVSGWPAEARRLGKQIWQPLPMEERQKVVAFKNFLNDFTISKEREAPEATLWQEYLVYAQLFGIADKVSRNLQKLYPEIYREYTSNAQLSNFDTRKVLHSVTRSSAAMLSAAKSEQSRISSLYSTSSRSSSSSEHRSRSYGGGGHSSYHGGGGHSGGGHGGGSR